MLEQQLYLYNNCYKEYQNEEKESLMYYETEILSNYEDKDKGSM